MKLEAWRSGAKVATTRRTTPGTKPGSKTLGTNLETKPATGARPQNAAFCPPQASIPNLHIRDGLRPLPPTPKNAPWYRPLIISAGSEGSRALFMAEVAWNHCLNGWKWGSKSIPGNRNRILGYPNFPWASSYNPFGSHGTPSPLGERPNACGMQRIAHPRREARWPNYPIFTPSPPLPEL